MRIIGGKWRGQKLADMGAGDKENALRPTSDRAREALFSALSHARYQPCPENRRVLDLFAGTGALGFEALSRGADFAYFVENGKIGQSLLRENCQNLQASEFVKIEAMSAMALPSCSLAPFDLVFLDPPYEKRLGEKAIASALEGGWIAKGGLIIWEEAVAPILDKRLKLLDERKIGRAILTIAEYKRKT